MKILPLEEKTPPSVLALGTFDGVHRGHLSVIKEAVALAKAEELVSVVYTFSNHPLSVFGKAPALLMDTEEKVQAFAQTGCDTLVLRPFDAVFASLSAEEFLSSLCTCFSPRHIVVGENFTFGKDRKGSTDFLLHNQKTFGFKVHVRPLLKEKGENISSSAIRKLLKDGKLCLANALLGYRYTLRGEIIHGQALGRRMGFPTINVKVSPQKLLPCFGVYAAFACIGGKTYPCVLNIGNRPTVNGQTVTVEAFLLRFSGEIYGERAALSLCAFLRPERRFENLEALSGQIAQDVQNAKKHLAL